MPGCRRASIVSAHQVSAAFARAVEHRISVGGQGDGFCQGPRQSGELPGRFTLIGFGSSRAAAWDGMRVPWLGAGNGATEGHAAGTLQL